MFGILWFCETSA